MKTTEWGLIERRKTLEKKRESDENQDEDVF